MSAVRFSWDADELKCRATAFDKHGNVLGEVTVDLPQETHTTIWAHRGPGAKLRVEEAAERHLRAMLDMRF